MLYLYKIKTLHKRYFRITGLSMVCAFSLLLQSCFENTEFFVNFNSQHNIPLNVVIPLIYEGTTPIKLDELHNKENYSLLGNCAPSQTSSSLSTNQSEKSAENSSPDQSQDKEDEINLSTELSGTPIPLFIIPTEGYETLSDNRVRQHIYIMPEALAPGEHFCLTVQPMYKQTKDLSEITQAFTFEFDTVGKKTSPNNEYSGPKYSDPDFFELSFPMPYIPSDDQQQENYLLPVHHLASKTFSPLFKFAKQGMPDDAFLADPRKVHDSISVCEILKTPQINEGNDNKNNYITKNNQDCNPVQGLQVRMIEDLSFSEDGKYTLSNYAYFTISGGALKLNTPYQIKVLYPFGDSKENISLSNQVHSFMMVDDDLIISTLAPDITSESKEQSSDTQEPEETDEISASEPEQKPDNSDTEISSSDENQDDASDTLSLSPKDLFDRFKHAHGQVPGEGYIEIPIRSSSSTQTKK
ncbi:hypothetical protein MRY82_04235 [bacterium]|nr:hypothetical protein [bacterium]